MKETLTIMIPAEVKDALVRAAKKTTRSQGQYVEYAVRIACEMDEVEIEEDE